MWKLFDNFYVRRVASFFLAIVDFRYWAGVYYNSEALDRWIWSSLNYNGFRGCDEYVANISGVDIWHKNYPYSSGCVYTFGTGLDQHMPTIITRYRLNSYVKEILRNRELIKEQEFIRNLK